MRTRSPFSVLAIAALTVAGIVACGSSTEDANVTIQDEGTSPEAKPTNPCLSIKCPDAHHCVAKGKNPPSCVADPACTADSDCYLDSILCDGQCACVAHEKRISYTCTSGPSPSCTDPCPNYTVSCQSGVCTKTLIP